MSTTDHQIMSEEEHLADLERYQEFETLEQQQWEQDQLMNRYGLQKFNELFEVME